MVAISMDISILMGCCAKWHGKVNVNALNSMRLMELHYPHTPHTHHQYMHMYGALSAWEKRGAYITVAVDR